MIALAKARPLARLPLLTLLAFAAAVRDPRSAGECWRADQQLVPGRRRDRGHRPGRVFRRRASRSPARASSSTSGWGRPGGSHPPRTATGSRPTRRNTRRNSAATAPGRCRKATPRRSTRRRGRSSTTSSTSTTPRTCRPNGPRTSPATSPRATPTGRRSRPTSPAEPLAAAAVASRLSVARGRRYRRPFFSPAPYLPVARSLICCRTGWGRPVSATARCHHDQGPEQAGLARDPVCGMSVDAASAKHRREHDGRNFYFCSEHCARKFAAAPDDYLNERTAKTERSAGGRRLHLPDAPRDRAGRPRLLPDLRHGARAQDRAPRGGAERGAA